MLNLNKNLKNTFNVYCVIKNLDKCKKILIL